MSEAIQDVRDALDRVGDELADKEAKRLEQSKIAADAAVEANRLRDANRQLQDTLAAAVNELAAVRRELAGERAKGRQ